MAKKVSDHFKSYVNTNGPTVSTVSRKIIQYDGLYFKDIDGSGQLSPVNDWRLAPEERAAAYAYRDTAGNYYGLGFGLRY